MGKGSHDDLVERLSADDAARDDGRYPPARRITIRRPDGSSIGFSIPAGVSNADGMAAARDFHNASLTRLTRRVVRIDGPPGRARYRVDGGRVVRLREPFPRMAYCWWAARVAWSYVAAWFALGWRLTVRRRAVAKDMAQFDEALSTQPTDTTGEPNPLPDTKGGKG